MNSSLSDEAGPNTKEQRDGIYAARMKEVASFVFDERVAAVFPDMISRSVPGYATIIGMIGMLASDHATSGSKLYDLGCSLGAASTAMRMNLQQQDCRIIAVDNAPAMLEKAKQNLHHQPGVPIEFVCADIQDVEIHDASVVVLNFTLQFLPVEERLTMLSRIREGMLPDGVLILSEKFAGASEQEEQRLVALHHMFKRANGYSDLEISQKRSALENVLLPETIETHLDRLQQAGFSRVNQWFQCFNFASFVIQP